MRELLRLMDVGEAVVSGYAPMATEEFLLDKLRGPQARAQFARLEGTQDAMQASIWDP